MMSHLANQGSIIRRTPHSPSSASLEGMRYERAILLLILIAIICFRFLPILGGQQYSEKASISSTEYVVEEDSVTLTVTISYSYGTTHTLKVTVSLYNPSHDYEQIIGVGPGTGLRMVSFVLEPKPPGPSSTATVSLYASNANGDSLDLLGAKEVNLDLTNSSQSSWGGWLLVGGGVILVLALYYTRTRDGPSKLGAREGTSKRRRTQRKVLVGLCENRDCPSHSFPL
jgi:hypothetical protein